MSIEQGQFCLIIGRTGSGKSTLLKQLKPELSLGNKTAGTLTLFNDPQEFHDEQVSYISQFVDNQMVTETPRDEFHFVLENKGYDRNQAHTKIAEIASYLDIVSLLDLNESQLSGGQKQLVNLAASLILSPKVLLLDEPTSQLDPITAEKFLQMIQKINSDLGITILLVEHSIEQAVFFADRIIVVDDGSVLLDDLPDKALKRLFQNPRYINYLPQIDRLYLERNLAKVKKDILPLHNHQLTSIIAQSDSHLKYHQSEKEKAVNSENSILKIKHLNFRFAFNSRNILDDISMDLQSGNSYGILGPNGVGKTTLFRVIIQQLKRLHGSIAIDGVKIKKADQKFFEKIFVVPQNTSLLFVKDSVSEEIEYQLKQANKIGTAQVLSEYHLDAIKELSPYDLSGGQQEYLAIVLGLIKQPRLLMLDEPTKGLDPNAKIKVAELLKQYQAQGGTILANTHDVLFSAKHFDFVTLMFDGKISPFERPVDFFANKYFYTTEINKATRDFFPKALVWEDIEKNET